MWKQHPLDRYFADAATLSEHLTIAKCPLGQTGNHWDGFPVIPGVSAVLGQQVGPCWEDVEVSARLV